MTVSPGESSGGRPNLAGQVLSNYAEREAFVIDRIADPDGMLRAFLATHELVVGFVDAEEQRRAQSQVEQPGYYGELLESAMDAYNKLLDKVYGLEFLSEQERDSISDMQGIEGREKRESIIARIVRGRSAPSPNVPTLSEQLNEFLGYEVESLDQSTPVEEAHALFGVLQTLGYDWLNADLEGAGLYVADPAVNEHPDEFIKALSMGYGIMVSKVLGKNEDIVRLQSEASAHAQRFMSNLN